MKQLRYTVDRTVIWQECWWLSPIACKGSEAFDSLFCLNDKALLQKLNQVIDLLYI